MYYVNFFKYLVEQIHTTVVATVDENGYPVTSAIDIMDYDENGIYFLTAKGKGFYRRLKSKPNIALTGVKGNSTMNSIAISICGSVEEMGDRSLDRLIMKNPYMNEIYPTDESKKALTVFRIYKGTGELFDLSKKPIERKSFTFGKINSKVETYCINDKCDLCMICKTACPQQCIDFSGKIAKINNENCLYCGNCMSVCPRNAVEII